MIQPDLKPEIRRETDDSFPKSHRLYVRRNAFPRCSRPDARSEAFPTRHVDGRIEEIPRFGFMTRPALGETRRLRAQWRAAFPRSRRNGSGPAAMWRSVMGVAGPARGTNRLSFGSARGSLQYG